MEDKNESAKYYVGELVRIGYTPQKYPEWITERGFELADLGEFARPLFHELSKGHTEYDHAKADSKFSDLLKNHRGKRKIESLFHFCHHEMNIPAPKLSNNGNHMSGNSNSFSQNGNGNKLMKYRRQDEPPPLDKDPVLEGEKWLMDIDDIMEAPDVEKICYFFIKGSNNALVASSEAGKTTLMSCLAFAIAMGWEHFLGWPINALKGAVLIVSTEDGVSSFKGRLNKLKRKYGLPDKSSIRFIFDSYRVKEKIEYALNLKPCDLIIIDTWGDYIGGEYVGEKTRPMMNDIKRICQKYDGTPVYVHHTNKASENIPDKSSIKGAGDFEQANRSVIMLNVFRESRWLSIVKLNEFTDEQKKYSFRLDYDHDTGMVERSDEIMERIEIVKELRSDIYGATNKKETNWNDILNPGEFLSYKELADKVMDTYGIQDRAAKGRIKKAIDNKELHKIDNGSYSLTAF